MQITLLIGLPGSGKTTIAKQIIGETEEFIRGTRDDDGHSKTSKKYITGSSIILDDIRNAELDLPDPGEYEHIIITDVYLCHEDVRENAIDILLDKYEDCDPKVVMIFFENNPEKCSTNSKHRDDEDIVLEHIKGLADIYTIPDNAPIHEIWQPKKKSNFQPFSFNGNLIEIIN